jgi:GNAT superfamily N-acetyltransferase
MTLGWRPMTAGDRPRVAQWNRELQEDEGSTVMTLPDLAARLDRLLAAGHGGVIFELDGDTVGYALIRPTDGDLEGPGGVYVRHFYIVRSHRRSGMGRRALETLRTQVLAREPRILLDTVATNHAGQAFWRAMGFVDYSSRFEWIAPSAVDDSRS